ncbi:MAG: hypothetical protein WCV84_02515 [Patescibacteria group bacterium]
MTQVFRSIAHGSAVITASRLLLKVLALGSYYIILRKLSLHDYGIVTLALSISGPVLAISGLGLDDLVFANGARARGEKRFGEYQATIRGFLAVKFVLVIALTLMLIWVQTLLGQKYQDLLAQFFLPLLCWIWVTNIRGFFDAYVQMCEEFSVYARASIVESIIRLILVVGFFLFWEINIATVLWAYVLSKALGSAEVILAVFRHKFASVALHASLIAYVRFVREKGAWEIARMLVGQLLSNLGQWLLGIMVSVEAVALMSFATTLNSIVTQLSPFKQVLLPVMARLSAEAGSASLVARRMSKYGMWLAVVVVCVSAVVAPIGVAWMVPKYLPAIPLFYLAMVSQLINATTMSHGSLMYAYNEQRYLLGLSLFGTLSSFTLLPALTWTMGAYGVLIENHVSTIVIAWLRERRLRSKYGVSTFRIQDLWHWTEEDRTTLLRVIAAVRTRVRSRL